jgi:hypothetical protein
MREIYSRSSTFSYVAIPPYKFWLIDLEEADVGGHAVEGALRLPSALASSLKCIGQLRAARRLTDQPDYENPQRDCTTLDRTPEDNEWAFTLLGGFATTSAVEAILRQCMAMENAALDLERVATGRDSLATGSLRVTTTDALGYQLVVPAIAALRQTRPD